MFRKGAVGENNRTSPLSRHPHLPSVLGPTVNSPANEHALGIYTDDLALYFSEHPRTTQPGGSARPESLGI
jgi:hypothetical protein